MPIRLPQRLVRAAAAPAALPTRAAAMLRSGGPRGGALQRPSPRLASRCRSVAPAGGLEQAVTAEGDFDRIVADERDKLVVLSCSATWCGPCKVFKPTYGQFAEAYHDQAVFLNVTGDANKSTAALMKRLNVKSVPAFFLYRAGAQVGTFTGANKTAFRAQLKAHINLFD